MENNFTKTIKGWLIDQLIDCKGWNEEVHIHDLAFFLTESINVNGSVYCSRYKAEEFIKENFEEFGELLDYLNSEFGMFLNVFREPEKAEVIAYIEGINFLINQLETIKEIEDNEIILSDELIDEIIEELENNSYNIEF